MVRLTGLPVALFQRRGHRLRCFAVSLHSGLALWTLAVLAVTLMHPQTGWTEEEKKEEQAEEEKPKPVPVFKDKRLEAAVRRHVFEKRDNDEPITAEDVRNVAVVNNAQDRGIRDLTGLEHCLSLAAIDLSGNEVTDLKPIKDLKQLQSVTLTGNRISDLAPLSGLTGLQYLQLADNRVSDVAPLASLVKLNSLYLSNNSIRDISPLAGLEKLWSLYLDGNDIEDLKPIAKLTRLSSLDLRSNKITDLMPLAGFTELKYLMLENNQVEDLAVLVDMAAKDDAGDRRFAPFWHVYLNGNPLGTTGQGPQIGKLKELGSRIHWKRQ